MRPTFSVSPPVASIIWAVVDFPHDLIDAGQALAEEILRPALQGLGHDGMVGIGHGAGDQIPSRVPGIAALIQQDAHQLGNGQGGVGVVDVDGGVVRQVVQGAELLEVAAHDVLHRGGDQEILLRQPQGFALPVIIGGVEHLGDDLGHGLLLHGAHILTLVEQGHVHARGGGAPQPQGGHAAAILARDHQVVGLGDDDVGVVVHHVVEAVVVPPFPDIAVGQFGPGQQPAFPAGEPEIGQLGLPAVHQLLAENAVFIQ